ncbi:MAG: PKD domain-containing protein [Bacteroidales bacterium]|nr:PKD domain-containing protein [Bacteroidales bacterium]
MKLSTSKNLLKIKFTLFLVFTHIWCNSQIGKDCNNPFIITELPFQYTGTTNGYGNDYTEMHACSSVYMSGQDFVFAYTPQSDIKINIKTSNTNVLVGLFVFNGCPDNATTICRAKVEATGGNPEILKLQLFHDTTYYIIIDTYNAANLFPYTPFSISISESYNIDIAPFWLFRPRSGCHHSAKTQVTIVYHNYGSVPVDSVYCGYQLDENPPVVELNFDTINPGESIYFTFADSANLSISPMTHKLKMFTITPGDENTSNDTIWKWLTTNIMIEEFPYFENFENSSGWWVSEWINHEQPGTSWEWGTPAKTIINETATGNKCWVTSLTGHHLAPENSYVLSPCFNFSTLTNPVLEMDIWYETSNLEFYQIEYSIDSGYTWHRLGNTGEGINWYNTPYGYNDAGWAGHSGGWLRARHKLDNLGGKPYVLLRVTLRAAINSYSEGFAFDNVKISESPLYDVKISDLIYPFDSCGLNKESFKIVFTNEGLNHIYEIPIKIEINNGSQIIFDTLSTNLHPFESDTLTTNKTINLSSFGQYSIKIEVLIPNDENPLNNVFYKTIMNFPTINAFPYIEDFEVNDGYWFSYGQNNSWEWGSPTDSIINCAYSGSNIWATNLHGQHNFNEESYVESPCFDLSFLKKPIFKSVIWYKQTYPTYTQVQIKNNVNTSWAILGSANDSNWYNSGYSWTYSSNGWIRVKHSLKNYISQQTKLRYKFLGTIPDAGFAFDLIEICDAPQANFTYTAISQNNQNVVYFTNLSERYTNCLWVFGDGDTSTEASPVHVYNTNDSVLVSLYVWSNCDIDSVKKYINPVKAHYTLFNQCLNIKLIKENLIIENFCGKAEYNVKFYNVLGQVIKNENIIIENTYCFYKDELPNGIKFLIISSNKQTFVFKAF